MPNNNSSVTRSDVTEAVARETPLGRQEALNVVNGIISEIKNSISKGDEVKIQRFGKFEIQKKRPRRGRNPQTGDDITVSGRKSLKFRPSNLLREDMNRLLGGGGANGSR